MFKGTFEYETTLPHHIDEVWSFFSTAHNLVRISTYPKVSVQSDPAMAEGNLIQLQLNFRLFRLKWLLTIQDVQEKCYFIDEAVHVPFPFRGWRHGHYLARVGDCTIMKDKVEFQAYAPAFLIRLALRGMFRDRERAIKRLMADG
jgi:ligand-binding SRPBCC domain-containing protein